MEQPLALLFLIALAVLLFWVSKCLFIGVVKAFGRCWWLALFTLIVAPALLFVWAFYEALIDDEPINTDRRKE